MTARAGWRRPNQRSRWSTRLVQAISSIRRAASFAAAEQRRPRGVRAIPRGGPGPEIWTMAVTLELRDDGPRWWTPDRLQHDVGAAGGCPRRVFRLGPQPRHVPGARRAQCVPRRHGGARGGGPASRARPGRAAVRIHGYRHAEVRGPGPRAAPGRCAVKARPRHPGRGR